MGNSSLDSSIDLPLLDRKDICKLLGVHKATIKRWEAEGKLKAVRLSARTLRYRREEIERLLREAE